MRGWLIEYLKMELDEPQPLGITTEARLLVGGVYGARCSRSSLKRFADPSRVVPLPRSSPARPARLRSAVVRRGSVPRVARARVSTIIKLQLRQLAVAP